MAIVVEKQGRREYLSPTPEDSEIASATEFADVVGEARSTFLSPTTPTRAMITGACARPTACEHTAICSRLGKRLP